MRFERKTVRSDRFVILLYSFMIIENYLFDMTCLITVIHYKIIFDQDKLFF